MTTCQQTRISDINSIAVGPQDVPYTCGQPATQTVFLDGAVHYMCEQCAADAVKDFGATQLRQDQELGSVRLRELGALLSEASQDFANHGEIRRWLQEASVALDDMATSLLEGRL